MKPLAPVVLLGLLGAGVARADPMPVSISWGRGSGAATCGDERALRQRLAQRVGVDLVAPDAPTRVETWITGDGRRWTVSLFVRDRNGAQLAERSLELESSDCGTVLDAVALIIAASLEHAPDAPPAPPAPAAPPRLDPPLPPPPPPPPPPPARVTRSPRWRVAFDAAGGISWGALPALAADLSLRADVTPPRWPVLYVAVAWSPEVTASAPPGLLATTLVTGMVGVCPWRGTARAWQLFVCADVRVGVLAAAGRGFHDNRIVERPYVAFDVGLKLRWNFTRHLHATLLTAAELPVVRDTLAVEGLGELHRASIVGLRASLGLGGHFE